MGAAVNGHAYIGLAYDVREQHGMTLREFILKRINEDGVRHAALARELGIPRNRLYNYAKALGIDLQTVPKAIDLWAQMGAQIEPAGTEG